jgi:hypothetical protein
MADHSKPTTTSTYSNFVTELDGRLDDLALGLDPATTTPTNVPTNSIRWSSASNTWQKWNGTSWSNLSSTYALTTVTASGSLTVNGNSTLGDSSADTVTINGTVQPGVVLSGSSSGDALRITQTGTGNALVVEDSTNPDSTPFVIDSIGRVIVGHTSSITSVLSQTPFVQTVSTVTNGVGGGVFGSFNYRADTSGGGLSFNKSRATTPGTNAVVSSGDNLGALRFAGDDGTAFIPAAYIQADVDGTPGTNDMPGRLVFSTTADGASSPTERMRINSAGTLIIGSGEASATPVGNTIHAPDAAGTNIAGANLTINAGNSTGNALGGYVGIGATSSPGASGTSANAQLDRIRVYSTSGVADGLAGVHVAQGGAYPTTIPLTNGGDRGAFTVHGTSEATANVQIINWGSSTADEPNLNFLSLNGNAVGTFGTVPTSGFNLGIITFEGYSGSGSGMLSGAAILAEASGTWTSTTSPSLLRLQTAAATGGVATRILIDEDAVSIEANTGFSISETTATTAALANAYIGNVSSGTYTPTLTNTTNITSSTPSTTYYTRVGNMVMVSGRVTIDPTATGSITLGFSLPIASDISNNCWGVCNNQQGDAISVTSDNTNDRASFVGIVADAASRVYSYTFQYQVL